MIRNNLLTLICLFTLSFLVFSFKIGSKNGISILTYNIRLATETDGPNYWEYRKEKVLDLINKKDPDIAGFQEVLLGQMNYLTEGLIDYDSYGVGRDDGKEKGEMAPLFWKKNRFTPVDKGHFWLKESPETPGPGWDANLNRIATWVMLKDKNDKLFFVLNTHFDHEGKVARKESAKLIKEKALILSKGNPVIIMGDLNAEVGSEPYSVLTSDGLLHDTFIKSKGTDKSTGTFAGGFAIQNLSDRKIDHIFCTSHFKVKAAYIDKTSHEGFFPSDHLPVGATVSIK